MKTIGLIAAMAQESKALLRLIGERISVRLGKFSGTQFQVMDRTILLVTSGMGIIKAEDAARTLLGAVNPDLLISFGIAGAVNPNLNIGDVVISNKTCLWENERPGESHPLVLPSSGCWKAMESTLQAENARLMEGTAITTRGSQVGAEKVKGLSNPILEMETIGIARVVVEYRIPLLSIRSISDGPNAPIPLDLAKVMDEKYHFRIGPLLGEMMKHPEIIFHTGQVIHNSNRAAEIAALAVIALLNLPSPII